MKRALITGITGQDGSYLTELLLGKGYEVHGLHRRASLDNLARIAHLSSDAKSAPNLMLHYGDLSDGTGLSKLLDKIQPDEVYNLGAQSHVRVSFESPEFTSDVVATGALRLLEATRDHMIRMKREVRFYQAGSSEMFGAAPAPQGENTPFHPRSPYAVAKMAAHWYCINYRESYGMFVSNGILFNHESPRRGETFVTRKITRAVGRIKQGLQRELLMGNLDARRDWGFAGDYVEAMWRMLQHDRPGDYVVATGTSYSVQQFIELAFARLDLDWHQYVKTDPRFLRPAEVDHLHGDASKAKKELGWTVKTDLPTLVNMMVDSDHELAKQERMIKDSGKTQFGIISDLI